MVEFTINEIKEHIDESFTVYFDTLYGERKFKFKKDMKYIHIETGKPQFIHKIKEFVEKKYAKLVKPEASKEFQDIVGTKYESIDLEDRTVTFLSEEVKRKSKTKETKMLEIEDSMKIERDKSELLIKEHMALMQLKHKNALLQKKIDKEKIEVNK